MTQQPNCGSLHAIVNNFISPKPTTSAIVYVLLFVLLSVRVGGAVSHYCFDGMEPPVTMHFDNLSGHVEHTDESGHTDIEKQVLSDNLLSKIFELASLFLITTLFFLAFQALKRNLHYLRNTDLFPTEIRKFRPALRAPPFYS